jgi:predicted RNase H-like HicB family nuclease
MPERGQETALRYHINLFWSAEDACWVVADVPDLRFCSAFGETPEAAARGVQIAIQAWLASAREHGDPISASRYRPAIYAARAVAQGNWLNRKMYLNGRSRHLGRLKSTLNTRYTKHIRQRTSWASKAYYETGCWPWMLMTAHPQMAMAKLARRSEIVDVS